MKKVFNYKKYLNIFNKSLQYAEGKNTFLRCEDLRVS